MWTLSSLPPSTFLVFSPWNYVSRAMLILRRWISCTWDKENMPWDAFSQAAEGHGQGAGTWSRGGIPFSARLCHSKLSPSAVWAGDPRSNQHKADTLKGGQQPKALVVTSQWWVWISRSRGTSAGHPGTLIMCCSGLWGADHKIPFGWYR